MAKQNTPSRRAPQDRSASNRQGAARRSDTGKQAPARRTDVIRCENCGEDYAITYKRCPFCDERPGRRGIGGRRVAGSQSGDYRGPVHPVQVIGLVVSLVLIIAALFIVFKYIGPLLFGPKGTVGSESGGISQSVQQDSSSGQSGSASAEASSEDSVGGEQPEPEPQSPPAAVTAITLSRTDFTLSADETYQLLATITPADSQAVPVWSSSDPSVLEVDASGTVKNMNSGTAIVKVTVTVTCGDQSAECLVYCKPSGGGNSPGAQEPAAPSTGRVSPNTPAAIVNAGSGLNIRSGPGSTYEIVASASNGAAITILEDTGDGWYKIDYGAGKIGYVSSQYVAVQ